MFGEHEVAIITGIGPGMGHSIALGFARNGVDVVLAARRADVPVMREQGKGSIVLVSTGAVISNPPRLGAYTASKGALAGVARTLAVEVGEWGIRANGVFLGGVAGDNILHAAKDQAAAAGITPEEWLERRDATLPLRHMPTADECAGTVLFLCSDLAAAVTGQHISVNGGQWTT